LISAGAGVIALGLVLGLVAPKGKALIGLGAVGVLVGLGWLYSPWTPEMVAANSGDDFGKLWRLMPLFWKLWFVFSTLAGVALMVAALILW
jgi:hypothetical protein